jgi:hypothetical protein
MMRVQPRCDLLRHKLQTIVTLHTLRGATMGKQPLEYVDDSARCDRAGTVNAERVSKKLHFLTMVGYDRGYEDTTSVSNRPQRQRVGIHAPFGA